MAKSCDRLEKDIRIIDIPNVFIVNLLFQDICNMNSN